MTKEEIEKNDYDLSLARYQELEPEELEYESPKVIVDKLRALESEIRSEIDALEGMLG